MQLLDYYLVFCRKLAGIKIGVEYPIALQQLSSILYCSERNILYIFKKMEGLRWLKWVPGRGRGNYSKLTLHMTESELALQVAKELVDKADLQGAFLLVDKFPDFHIKEQIITWLTNYIRMKQGNEGQSGNDNLVVTMDDPILTFDPAYHCLSSERHLIQHIFDSLVVCNDQTKEIEPHIAHFWETDQAGITWKFYLRRGVYFHHKRELTAHDVLFSLNRLRNEKSDKTPFHLMYRCMKELKVLGNSCIEIQLDAPNSLFLHFLSRPQASIVPEDVYGMNDAKTEPYPIGTGPFLLEKQESSMILKAFPSYFKGRALIDQVEIYNLPAMRQKSLLKRNDDIVVQYSRKSELDNGYIRGDEQASPIHWKKKTTGLWYRFLTFNLLGEGPQQNERFRQAMAYGMDRIKMARELGQANYTPVTGLPYDLETSKNEEAYDPVMAQEILAELGYQGETLQLFTSGRFEKDAYWIQEHYKQIGITMDVTVVPLQELFQSEQMNAAHLIVFGIVIEHNMEASLLEFCLPEYNPIRTQMNEAVNSSIGSLVTQVYTEANQSKRLEVIKQIENVLKEHVAVIFLYRQNQNFYYHSALDGIALDSAGWLQYQNVWIRPN